MQDIENYRDYIYVILHGDPFSKARIFTHDGRMLKDIPEQSDVYPSELHKWAKETIDKLQDNA